ncbi:MAG TPA: DUF6763 family protein [Steroidobacteraceae bacterium]|nr:DUF6763 family protein [Steroidobacteraceae bacterium]
MATRMLPEVGRWYSHRDKGQIFQVVAYDEDEGYVETQDFDGDVDEIDLDTWLSMPLDRAEAPEDWTGPVDDVEPGELGYESATDVNARDWRGPLDEFPAPLPELSESEDSDDEPKITAH